MLNNLSVVLYTLIDDIQIQITGRGLYAGVGPKMVHLGGSGALLAVPPLY